MLTIRKFKSSDVPVLRDLFFNTVRNVNVKDYSGEQVKAWATETYNFEEWSKGYHSINPFVAEIDGEIVGYADLQENGFIDHFYCHWKYQRKGIGKALMNKIIEEAKAKNIERIFSHVSITAKAFFESFGFEVIKEQEVNIRGQMLSNNIMQRNL